MTTTGATVNVARQDAGGVHYNISTPKPQGQHSNTTPSPSSNNTPIIVTGIVVPLVLVAIGAVIFYVWYRRKYPVRMVYGKDFSRFTNPAYNKRASTITLVRNDAQGNDIPFDALAQRNLAFVEEDELNETAERDPEENSEATLNNGEIETQHVEIVKEVKIPIETVKPEADIKRPRRAVLIQSNDEELDNAFEMVTESDLGQRTESELSSGNDSTDTHTISISFAETFDGRFARGESNAATLENVNVKSNINLGQVESQETAATNIDKNKEVLNVEILNKNAVNENDQVDGIIESKPASVLEANISTTIESNDMALDTVPSAKEIESIDDKVDISFEMINENAGKENAKGTDSLTHSKENLYLENSPPSPTVILQDDIIFEPAFNSPITLDNTASTPVKERRSKTYDNAKTNETFSLSTGREWHSFDELGQIPSTVKDPFNFNPIESISPMKTAQSFEDVVRQTNDVTSENVFEKRSLENIETINDSYSSLLSSFEHSTSPSSSNPFIEADVFDGEKQTHEMNITEGHLTNADNDNDLKLESQATVLVSHAQEADQITPANEKKPIKVLNFDDSEEKENFEFVSNNETTTSALENVIPTSSDGDALENYLLNLSQYENEESLNKSDSFEMFQDLLGNSSTPTTSAINDPVMGNPFESFEDSLEKVEANTIPTLDISNNAIFSVPETKTSNVETIPSNTNPFSSQIESPFIEPVINPAENPFSQFEVLNQFPSESSVAQSGAFVSNILEDVPSAINTNNVSENKTEPIDAFGSPGTVAIDVTGDPFDTGISSKIEKSNTSLTGELISGESFNLTASTDSSALSWELINDDLHTHSSTFPEITNEANQETTGLPQATSEPALTNDPFGDVMDFQSSLDISVSANTQTKEETRTDNPTTLQTGPRFSVSDISAVLDTTKTSESITSSLGAAGDLSWDLIDEAGENKPDVAVSDVSEKDNDDTDC